MNRALLTWYHRLPPQAQEAAAGLRGLYLRSWRYGRDTDRLVDEAIARESWTDEQWRTWRDERTAFVLDRAATRVPYYRDMWAERRRRGDMASWTVLANWPVLEKNAVREAPRRFVADDCDPSRLFHEHTSGTTGTSLDLWWSRRTVREWYALFEARWRHWYGVSRHDRWAIIGGQLVVPIARRRPPFWVWNPALHQLYMSAYHLAPDLAHHFVRAMRDHRVRYLFGYSSALHALASSLGDGAGRDLGLAVVVTNAEPLLDHQRETIERAFGCPVRETYGMAEIVTAASECEHGRMHLWPEVGVVEVLDAADAPVPTGTAGQLVCTGLVNQDMPLVRYRVGDRAAENADTSACACGRRLPRLASIEGRNDDTLYTLDGRAVGRMDPVFKSRAPVLEAQIVQESLSRIRVRVVPAVDYTAAAGASIAERIRDRLGDVDVEIETVSSLPRSANGKLRAVVCALAPEELARVRTRGERSA